MWSKERKKRQARLDAAGKTGNGTVKIPDVSDPPSLCASTDKGTNNLAQQKTTVVNTTKASEIQSTVKQGDKLPPPPPLPALNTTLITGTTTQAKNSSSDSGYNDTPPTTLPTNSNEVGFIHRGFSNPSKLLTNDTSKDIATNANKVPASNKKSLPNRRSSLNADVKLNHFISQPLNLRNISTTADNGSVQRSSQWPT